MSLCLLAFGCATSRPAGAPVAISQQASETGVSAAERRLLEAVRKLESARPDDRRAQTAAALRALASSLYDLPRSWDARELIGTTAEQINGPGLAAAQWEPLLGECLEQVRRTLLEAAPPPRVVGAYWKAMQALSGAAAGLRGPNTATARPEMVAQSLRAATDAVFILRGGRPPFAVAGAPADPTSATMALASQRAREAVRDMRSPDGGKARTAAAAALQSLADVLATMAGSTGGGAPPPAVAKLRLQASRLRSLDLLALDESAWAKAGLDAALTGLDQVAPGRGGDLAGQPHLLVWIEEARGAVESIDGRTTFTFQRAAIQDAFRTVVTAFAVAVRDGEAGRPAEVAQAAAGASVTSRQPAPDSNSRTR